MAEAKKDNGDRQEVAETAGENGTTGKEPSAQEIPVGNGDTHTVEEQTKAADEVDPVEALEARVRELEDQKLRALADRDNFRKRMSRQFEEVVRAANDRLLSELLEVVDNFERALAHNSEESSATDATLAALREGTELIYDQMRTFLEKHDVRPIESVGHPFDPGYHEAVMQMASDEYDEGTVVTEVSKGYMVGDRVLRHARVAVSQGPAEEGTDEA